MTNAACRTLQVHDAVQGADLRVMVLYPTREAERSEPFGAFRLALALDAAIDGEDLRLVVVSHGSGGTPWTHRDLSRSLARAGFVVALLQHPGNYRDDNGLAGTLANLENRPRHVQLAIDAVFADGRLGPRLRAAAVGVIGHSLGGYTALACAGGKPWAAAWETPEGRARAISVEQEARVGALVLLAPMAAPFLPEGALRDVTVPILMRTADKDMLTPNWHATIVARGLSSSSRLDAAVVPNAGHFAFLSAYPKAMRSSAIPPSLDPEGFDREAYLPVLFEEVQAFLREVL